MLWLKMSGPFEEALAAELLRVRSEVIAEVDKRWWNLAYWGRDTIEDIYGPPKPVEMIGLKAFLDV